MVLLRLQPYARILATWVSSFVGARARATSPLPRRSKESVPFWRRKQLDWLLRLSGGTYTLSAKRTACCGWLIRPGTMKSALRCGASAAPSLAGPSRPRVSPRAISRYSSKFSPILPRGLRNRAMIAPGYDLLTRRSELVAIRTEELERRADGTLRALIRRS